MWLKYEVPAIGSSWAMTLILGQSDGFSRLGGGESAGDAEGSATPRTIVMDRLTGYTRPNARYPHNRAEVTPTNGKTRAADATVQVALHAQRFFPSTVASTTTSSSVVIVSLPKTTVISGMPLSASNTMWLKLKVAHETGAYQPRRLHLNNI